MADIHDFLLGQETELARVKIAGGRDNPFYFGEVRSFWGEGPKTGTNAQIVEETVGLRSLLIEGRTELIRPKGKDDKEGWNIHVPTLLRAYPRPRTYKETRQLVLWTRHRNISGTFANEEAAADLLISPAGVWPDQETGIGVAPFRLVEGSLEVHIELADKSDIAEFLDFDPQAATLFDGLKITKTTDKIPSVAATLVPHGIEFNGTLPDPTLANGDAGEIVARFRLECEITRGEDFCYFLRLVDIGDGTQVGLDDLENRIATTFGALGPAGAPVAIRYDKRPRVPPIVWPLVMKKRGKKVSLGLIKVTTQFEIEIDRNAIDVRMKTNGQFPEEEQGLATIFATNVKWRRSDTSLDIVIDAGNPALIDDAPITIDFSKPEDVWIARLSDVSSRSFGAPLGSHAERLLNLYRDARAIGDAAERAPYFFVPVRGGWLQLALPAPVLPTQDLKAKISNHRSAMSGRIHASHGAETVIRRALVLDDASAMSLSISWEAEGAFHPKEINLKAGDPKGQLLGFLFVAETSPTAREALPTLRGGPAATRDLPLWFGTEPPKPYLRGTFEWQAALDRITAEIDTSVVPATGPSKIATTIGGIAAIAVADLDPEAIAWLPVGIGPFITNYPLTRTLPSAPEPSLSRNLVPRVVSGSITLKFNGKTTTDSLPVLTNATNIGWYELFQDDQEKGFRDDTLVLTTLAGVEFFPDEEKIDVRLFETTLRFDLPILDELFAWSDPPKKGTTAATVPDEVNLPTALEPSRLAKIWQRNRDRMALTRTQSAHATAWFTTRGDGGQTPQNISTLIETYSWQTDVGVTVDASDPFGSYTLGAQSYRLGSAAEGLGGAQRTLFGIDSNDPDRIVLANRGAIEIAGNAANLYTSGHFAWDSRGFAIARSAPEFLRAAKARIWDKATNKYIEHSFDLLTMATTEIMVPNEQLDKVWFFHRPIEFFVRDLPLTGLVFDGSTNPVEAGRGTNGQAFDQENFGFSLHEWRLFESFIQEDVTRRHDIRWGPFSFRPLRLERVQFDRSGQPQTVSVIGRMTLRDPVEDRPAGDGGPFGPDEVYLRGDLFRLKLIRATTGSYDYVWEGVAVATEKDIDGLFTPREPEISLAVTLTSRDNAAFYRSTNVESTIHLDIVKMKAGLDALLFGNEYNLQDLTAERTVDGFKFKTKAKKTGDGQGIGVLLFEPTIEVEVCPSAKILLIVDGPLLVLAMPRAKPVKEQQALASFAPWHFKWLDLQLPTGMEITIDHRTGRIISKWEFVHQLGGASVLFRLDMNGRFRVTGAFTFFTQKASETLTELQSIQMSSAWMRVTAFVNAKNRIDHHLLASSLGEREHYIEISWQKAVCNPIKWPIDKITKRENKKDIPVDDGSKNWLDPATANHEQDERSRIITIADDPNVRLDHELNLHLRRHRIEADGLTRTARRMGGLVTVTRPVRTMAVVDHKLIGAGRTATWTTIDHVVITTANLLKTEISALTFGPRYAKGKYRTASDAATIPRQGILPLSLAASGLHDQYFVEKVWAKRSDDVPVLLGGAVTLFPSPTNPQRSYAAVIPWLDVVKPPSLTQAGHSWRVATPDMWAGNPVVVSGTLADVVVNRDADSRTIRRNIGDGGVAPSNVEMTGGPDNMIPVEQAFFELWKNGQPSDMGTTDPSTVPFFLRAMLAIYARWKIGGKEDWKAATLHPGRFALVKQNGNEKDQLKAPVVAGLRASVREEEVLLAKMVEGAIGQELAVANLIVQSRQNAILLRRYRRIPLSSGEDLAQETMRGEMAEAALDEDRSALSAVLEIEARGELPKFALRNVGRGFDDADLGGRSLIHQSGDLCPSAALGWPSATKVAGLNALAPDLGDEHPVLSHEAGFAARFQVFGWPAIAARNVVGKNTGSLQFDQEAFYVSFANQIAYFRGMAPVNFDGPAARHLVPAIARRRAPTNCATKKTIAALLLPVNNEVGAAPILPPMVERGTVGRRPGVVEVSIASVTVPADRGQFDDKHERFGRPANSGPLAAYQLRNPRSPVLPIDQPRSIDVATLEAITINLRRRTYLSLADADPATFPMQLFGQYAGNKDVVRFEIGDGANKKHERVVFGLEGETYIGRYFAGELAIAISLKTLRTSLIGRPAAGTKVMMTGRLEIGSMSFDLAFAGADKKKVPVIELELEDGLVFKAYIESKLQEVQQWVREATVDTRIRLVLELLRPPAVFVATALPEGPRNVVTIPILLDPGNRRVVPIRANTIVFGDPAYDRQLASQTRSEPTDNGGVRFLLSADRREYDLQSTIYLAGGDIDRATGKYAEKQSSDHYDVTFRRLPPSLADGSQPAPVLLVFSGITPDTVGAYQVKTGIPIEIPLMRLVKEVGAQSALSPGDQLELSVKVKDDVVVAVNVDVVAEPVIAPPPAVYSVVEIAKDGQSAHVPLHAAAPLPQKIEFPDLIGDLALEHVRRRALFVWRFAGAESTGSSDPKIELIKFDRSGGAQLPD